MKKSIKMMIFLSAILSFTTIFCGCGNTNNNKEPPQTQNQILAPYIISLGNYLSWSETKNAVEYDIYRNNIYLSTTTKTAYLTEEADNDDEYYIVAKNKDVQSVKSNIAYVSKSKNYTADEILDLTEKSQFYGTISPEIRKIIIGKDFGSIFNFSAEIDERNIDLIIQLNNVSITGSIVTKDRSYSRKTNNYSMIFNVTGECSFHGENGLDGTDWSDVRYDNCELNAGEGYNGKDTVIVPSMIIHGNGNLSIYGGNGGNGGVGSSTTAYEKENCPGTGANGGNGGTAVKTSHLFLNMSGSECSVSILDGKGGLKGKPGENGSIYTGPLVTIMWNDMFDIGKAGTDAKSIIVSRKILMGQLIF